MIQIEIFREQHSELKQIVGTIAGMLTTDDIQNNSREIRSLLSRLAGKLSVHLSMEDKSLYPALYEHADESVKVKARAFQQEMGGLSEAFRAYVNKWPTPRAIEGGPEAFIKETKAVFQALDKRIRREDSELYRMLDRPSAR